MTARLFKVHAFHLLDELNHVAPVLALAAPVDAVVLLRPDMKAILAVVGTDRARPDPLATVVTAVTLKRCVPLAHLENVDV